MLSSLSALVQQQQTSIFHVKQQTTIHLLSHSRRSSLLHNPNQHPISHCQQQQSKHPNPPQPKSTPSRPYQQSTINNNPNHRSSSRSPAPPKPAKPSTQSEASFLDTAEAGAAMFSSTIRSNSCFLGSNCKRIHPKKKKKKNCRREWGREEREDEEEDCEQRLRGREDRVKERRERKNNKIFFIV
jgi:hypothetical protein